MTNRIKIIALFSTLLFAVVFLPACGSRDITPKIKPHILLVTIDTLRRDHLGCYGYPRQTSPFIDKLAREGVMFEYVTVPQPLTGPSHASILTSLHPLTHGTISNRIPLDSRVQTIAEKLQQHGYYTIGAVGVRILSGDKNFSQGFDAFSGDWPAGKKNTWKFQRKAQMVNKDLFKEIGRYRSQAPEKPLFIWLHYYDPHSPYLERIPVEFKAPLPYPPGDDRRNDKKIDNYDKEIYYTDTSLKKVFSRLEKEGLTDKLLTCVTADHGEEFGEHGTMYYHSDFYSETSLVPLIFHGFGVKQGKNYQRLVSVMDIAVTLLARLGLKFEAPTDGADLSTYLYNHKPAPLPERKFLIYGSPQYTRSLQLMGEMDSYILNFEPHYRNWFSSFSPGVPENLMQPVAQTWVKAEEDVISVTLPYTMGRGRNYLVFRTGIAKNSGTEASVQVMPHMETGWAKFPPRSKERTVDIIYPITVLDDLRIRLKTGLDTLPANARYAVISRDQFSRFYTSPRKIGNGIFNRIKSLRKQMNHDEYFDLTNDIDMQNNLISNKQFRPHFVKYKKLIYEVFRYYVQRKQRLFKGGPKKHTLTPQEREMLKSLGYL